MDYLLRGHSFNNEVYTIIQLFFPNERYTQVDNIGLGLVTESVIENGFCYAKIYINGSESAYSCRNITGLDIKQLKNTIKLTVFECFRDITGGGALWGILTGIRPTKKAIELMESGLSRSQAEEFFRNEYLVSAEKASLCLETAEAERKLLSLAGPNDVSIYIGIPFCPSKCLYCSFTSYPIEKYKEKIDNYLQALFRELHFIEETVREKNQIVKSLYIGGGTPTSLDGYSLEKLLAFIAEKFQTHTVYEFCVEAGRPDTIDAEKLRIMKKYGVGRVSINPQTMKNSTLDLIGRNHGVEDFLEKFSLARKNGFNNINVDLILGLPGESLKDTETSIRRVLNLNPEAVTIHTLCVKRASILNENLGDYSLGNAKTLEKMTSICYNECRSSGLSPYYLYRQKNSIGNLENIGYCRQGFECVYNVQIMEERQSIYAAGAGSVTKLYYSAENRVERSFNVKNVDEYILRIDEMIDRKRELL